MVRFGLLPTFINSSQHATLPLMAACMSGDTSAPVFNVDPSIVCRDNRLVIFFRPISSSSWEDALFNLDNKMDSLAVKVGNGDLGDDLEDVDSSSEVMT